MGLIKAAAGAIGSTFHDQWKEAIRCEEMGTEILMKKVTTSSHVISNGSTVIVAPGQCAIIFDNGRILDATAEEGIYTFDSSSTPSFFAGQFGAVFKEMWQRFTYNGATAKQQAVFFFNLHEIPGATFGTSNPLDFSDWSRPTPNQMCPGTFQPLLVAIKCHGTYTFKIENPALFMQEISGTADEFRTEDLTSMNTSWGRQLKAEAEDVFSEVVQELGTQEAPIPVEKLGSLRSEIKDIIDQRNFKQSCSNRGIMIVNFNIKGVSVTDESKEEIKQYRLSSNAMAQQGTLVNAYANAVQDAAQNASGAANGFMGIGMMNMASNGMIGGVGQAPWQNTEGAVATPPQPTKQSSDQVENSQNTVNKENIMNEWECSNCHTKANGNFCPECGAKKPENKKKFCSNCGKELDEKAKFCPECGNKIDD